MHLHNLERKTRGFLSFYLTLCGIWSHQTWSTLKCVTKIRCRLISSIVLHSIHPGHQTSWDSHSHVHKKTFKSPKVVFSLVTLIYFFISVSDWIQVYKCVHFSFSFLISYLCYISLLHPPQIRIITWYYTHFLICQTMYCYLFILLANQNMSSI